jgi:hypothetical protein
METENGIEMNGDRRKNKQHMNIEINYYRI